MTEHRYARRDEQLPPGDRPPTVDPTPLLGDWINTNPATTGIARVRISRDVGGVRIAIWPAGRSDGSARDHAIADALYANGPRGEGAMALSAAYENESARTTLEANLSLGLLVIASCHRWKQRDGRSNDFSREFFHYAERTP